MRSKKQKAVSRRNWGVLQLKGALAFLKQMGIHEGVTVDLDIHCRKALWARYEKELK